MTIYEGDQYLIPFGIKAKSRVITPENSTDVIIALGDMVKSYGEGELIFADNKYYFPLNKEESLAMPKDATCQIEIHINQDILHSKQFSVKIKPIKDVLEKRLLRDE